MNIDNNPRIIHNMRTIQQTRAQSIRATPHLSITQASRKHHAAPRSEALNIHRARHAPTVGVETGKVSVGALLRRYRLAAGLTQRALAERAGVSLRALNALELGHRQTAHKRTIALLADALHLAPDDRTTLEAAGRLHRQPGRRTLVLLSPTTPPAFNVDPASPSPHARLHNLPLPPSPVLGRERELAELTALLRQHERRLLTLTGPGGVGKTRLAIEVTWALRALRDAGDVFPDGVWLVRLAPLTDPALVLSSIAQTLGLSERGGASTEEALHAHLREKSLLLLLDNFEHVAAAAPQVARLLEQSAGLTILATSRAALRLRAEHNYPLAPLVVPPATRALSTEQLAQYAAATLFIERAQAIQPRFQVNDTTAPLIANICARLDGLPLAIELAASHLRTLPAAALLERLEQRLPLPTSGPMDLPARHQTLRQSIAWSTDLLEAEERRLFHRLAVFVGGATLAAVEVICLAPTGSAPLRLDALQGLSRLVDQSLVQASEENGEARFDLLHVIREYALERLEAIETLDGRPEAETLRRAHALYYCDLAERIEPELRGPSVAAWLATVERELGNVRAALGWTLASGEAELGLRLATALWRFWFQGGHLSEGQQWLETLLARADAEQTHVPTWLLARAQVDLGMLLATQRRFGPAVAALEAGITLGRAADDWLALSVGLQFSGAILRITGHTEQAEASFEEVVAIGRARGDALSIYTPLTSLAQIALDRGDPAGATARFSEAMAISRAAGHLDHVGATLLRLGELALTQSNARRAATLLRDAIKTLLMAGFSWALTGALELLATAYAQLGQEEQAARLFGAVATIRTMIESPYTPAEQPSIEALVAPVRAALSEHQWAAAFAAGQSLSLEEAIAEALAASDALSDEATPPDTSPSPAPHANERLTPRELEVLRLLAEGWSYHQIAERLVISPHTVNHHVSTIYDKLGVTSRVAALHAAHKERLL
jgi:predicted ATPase/DNA-binding CsgD family transcriptional regulator/DNA-binding XRE family transcriptional regulator